MQKKLPGEDLEIILGEYDRLKLGDVFDIAQRQEKRGNTGLVLKIYCYVLQRFGVTAQDGPFERAIGSIMYAEIGKLYMKKEEYAQAEAALDKAIELNSANHEALYWKGEARLRNGLIQDAADIFAYLAGQNIDF